LDITSSILLTVKLLHEGLHILPTWYRWLRLGMCRRALWLWWRWHGDLRAV